MVEAEALGARIKAGDSKGGVRAGEYLFPKPDQLLGLPPIDLTYGRIRDVLGQCRDLCEQGKPVMLQISGPLTVAGAFVDLTSLLKSLRKEPELAREILWKIGWEILRYAQAAAENGAGWISYADAAAGRELLGPSLERWMVERFTAPFLKEMEKRLTGRSMILLCPQIGDALKRSEVVLEKMWQMPEGTTYGEACLQLRGKVSMTGQVCVHREEAALSEGIFRQLELK